MDNTKQIMEVLESYISGTKNGDADLLATLFDKDAIMSGTLVNTQLICGSPKIFFEDVRGKRSDDSYHAEVKEININGHIATATLYESGMMGLNFVNHFHLKKDGSKWLIVSKLFTTLQED